MTATDLEEMGCGTPGCECVPDPLYLNSRCHTGGGVEVGYSRGVATVRCRVCDKLVAKLAITPADDMITYKGAEAVAESMCIDYMLELVHVANVLAAALGLPEADASEPQFSATTLAEKAALVIKGRADNG